MTADLPLLLQTAYAELLDRTASSAFDEAFADDGQFIAKTLRGRRYWYFQEASAEGRRQRYVGPETPDLLDRIARHKADKTHGRQRETLVSTLVRSGRLPRPLPQIGDVVAALARAGVFRLRGVLVGTVAYQTYAAMLGTRLPAAMIQTDDIDIAQFTDVSAAVVDNTVMIPAILRAVDPTFRPIPSLQSPQVASYVAASGVRVDLLTPNRGPERETPVALPAFGTDAQPLRFLDFLIVDPEPAVLLHGAGIYVSVPSPERYAVHKLIVSGRRRVGEAKQEKDLWQAQILAEALIRKRPAALRAAWKEATGRGKSWRRLMGEGMSRFPHPAARDRVLATVGEPRRFVPGLSIDFPIPHILQDADSDSLVFFGKSGPATVRFAVARELFEIRANELVTLDDARRLLRRDRRLFEAAARHKYLDALVTLADPIELDTNDLANTTIPALKTIRHR